MKGMFRFSLAAAVKAGVALALALPGALALAQTGGGYDLTWNTIDGGGATFSTGGVYSLGGTIGQPDASVTTMTGGVYSLSGGFWAGVTSPPATVTLTITVRLQSYVGSVTPITTKTFRVSVNGAPYAVVAPSGGSGNSATLSVQVPASQANFAVLVKADGFLAQKRLLTTTGSPIATNFFGPSGADGLLGGDTTGDNVIDDFDLFALTTDFLATPTPGANTDLNGDGNVDDFDLFTLTQNFLTAGDS